MPSSTTIRICDPFGNFLVETAEFLEAGNNPGLRYVLSCGNVGAMTVTLPPEYNPLLLKDGRIHIMRSVNGGPAQREGGSCFLIRRWDYADDYTTITAVHANDLMRRRHILYEPTLGYGGLSGPCDNVIKEFFRTNAGSLVGVLTRTYSTVTATNNVVQTDLSALVSVQADVSAAPSVFSTNADWLNMLEAIQETVDYSTNAGTWLAAEIIAPTETTLEFQTFTQQRSADRRFSTGNGLLFTSKRGNLENAILTVNAIEEVTFVQALGALRLGFLTDRYTGYAIDATRMAESPFGRTEAIVDSGDAPNDATLTNDSQSAVTAGRPVIHAVADLVETDQCVRGVDFDYGDYLTVEIQGIQYDMRLNIMEVTVSASGDRTVARFEFNA
jgi:hypothetical protein